MALDLAIGSLRRRKCDVAIVGGASVLLPQIAGYMSNIHGMFSPSGRVKPFDAGADGTVFGNGVGVVVLRPLDDALADGNPINAVIRGSGVSNDGNPDGKESFVAPSPRGQIAAVEAAMVDAGVGGESIGYLEAHGTATLLGDPVEVSSIADVYRRDTAKRRYCALGSVKGNVGHLRTAAGVVSLIKACLALKHRTLPPLGNFADHNPRIDFESSPFYVNTEPLKWVECAHPRRAAVSSFGFGGSNARRGIYCVAGAGFVTPTTSVPFVGQVRIGPGAKDDGPGRAPRRESRTRRRGRRPHPATRARGDRRKAAEGLAADLSVRAPSLLAGNGRDGDEGKGCAPSL